MDLESLPEEVKELVRAQIEAGHFRSVDEVVCEALRLLHEREELFASQREELCAQIAEGVAAEERGELRDGEEAVGTSVAGSMSGFAGESDSSIPAHGSGRTRPRGHLLRGQGTPRPARRRASL
jgi:putative addiction module CopG family antidote